MTRFVCLLCLGLVSVGCGPLRIGVFDPPSKGDAGAVAEAMEPLGSKLDSLVSKLDAQATTTGSVLAKLDAKLDERLPVPEAKPDVKPDAQQFQRHQPSREPEPLPTEMPALVRHKEPQPAPPVVETPFRPLPEPVADDRLDKLAAAVDSLRETLVSDLEERKAERVAAKAKPVARAAEPAGFTGAVIWTLPACPPGDQLKAHLRGAGWRVESGQNPHFWERPSQGQSCPAVEYFAGGKSLGTVVGYGGTQAELSAIVTRHPLVTSPRHVPALVQPGVAREAWDDPGPGPAPFDPGPSCAQSAGARPASR